MEVSSTLSTHEGGNQITLTTNGNSKNIQVASKPNGNGLSVNGGELFYLALATCFCNDIYREAAKRDIAITSVVVNVKGTFGSEGEPSSAIEYQAEVKSSNADRKQIAELINYVDEIAEIHRSVRNGTPVKLKPAY